MIQLPYSSLLQCKKSKNELQKPIQHGNLVTITACLKTAGITAAAQCNIWKGNTVAQTSSYPLLLLYEYSTISCHCATCGEVILQSSTQEKCLHIWVTNDMHRTLC